VKIIAFLFAALPLCAAMLPACHGDPTIDDTPMLATVIQKSNEHIWEVNPAADCYVHFTGANALPAGTKLEGTPAGGTLHLFTAADNLFSLNHSDITLDGLTLDSPFASITGYHGVLLWITGQNFRIAHCRVTGALATGTAIWAWNASGEFEDNEITGYSGQIFVTASPGKEPHIRIVGNRLHDNSATGGNAIGIASDCASKVNIPAVVRDNFIWNIAASATSTGQNGNGIDLDHASDVNLTDNYSKNTKFSCFRSFSSDDMIARGNRCINAGEVGGYSEYSSQHNQWIGNYFENSASSCLSLTNSDSNGQYHTAIANHMVGCGGAGIHAEAYTLVQGNIIDQAGTGITMGYGTFGSHVLAQGNVIMDTSGTKTQRGIGVESHAGPDMEVEGNMILLPAHQIEATAWGKLDGAGAIPANAAVR
jgi:hypothetical protein